MHNDLDIAGSRSVRALFEHSWGRLCQMGYGAGEGRGLSEAKES